MCAILFAGVKHIVLTMGPLGAALITSSGRSLAVAHAPALPARIANLSGAGDALVAGLLVALLQVRRSWC